MYNTYLINKAQESHKMMLTLGVIIIMSGAIITIIGGAMNYFNMNGLADAIKDQNIENYKDAGKGTVNAMLIEIIGIAIAFLGGAFIGIFIYFYSKIRLEENARLRLIVIISIILIFIGIIIILIGGIIKYSALMDTYNSNDIYELTSAYRSAGVGELLFSIGFMVYFFGISFIVIENTISRKRRENIQTYLQYPHPTYTPSQHEENQQATYYHGISDSEGQELPPPPLSQREFINKSQPPPQSRGMITITCPFCGSALNVPENMHRQWVQCPNCGNQFQVP